MTVVMRIILDTDNDSTKAVMSVEEQSCRKKDVASKSL